MREKLVLELYMSFGVLSCYAGYQYLIEAVCLAASEPRRLTNMRTGIYTPIADDYHVSCSIVEKDLRTMRNVIMKRGGGAVLSRMSGSEVWKNQYPYPRELISILADFVSSSSRVPSDSAHVSPLR